MEFCEGFKEHDKKDIRFFILSDRRYLSRPFDTFPIKK